jgi:hypothetical protein
MRKILLYNYALAIYLARGNKELFIKGTWYLLANELFFILLSVVILVITRFNVRLPNSFLALLLFTIWYLSFYGYKTWLINLVRTQIIAKTYRVNVIHRFIGLLLFVGTFILFLVTIIITFRGYLLTNYSSGFLLINK